MGNNRVVIPKLQYVYIHTKHNSHVGNKHPVKRPLSDFFTKYTSIFTRPFYLLISSAMVITWSNTIRNKIAQLITGY